MSKNKEAIFFFTYQSKNSQGDVIQYFPKEKTLKEFFEWTQVERKKLEESKNSGIILLDIKFITK